MKKQIIYTLLPFTGWTVKAQPATVTWDGTCRPERYKVKGGQLTVLRIHIRDWSELLGMAERITRGYQLWAKILPPCLK